MRRLALLLLVACSDPKAGSPPAPPPPPSPSPDAAPRAPSPSPALAPEIFSPDFYRAPDATATLRLPDLPAGTLVLPPTAAGAARALTITTKDPAGVIQILFHPRGEAPDVRAVARRLPALSPAAERTITTPAGPVRMLELAGKDGLGAAMTAGSEGGAVSMIAHATPADFPRLAPLVRALWGGLRLGAAVPRLPAHDPGTVLAGVYSGPTEVDDQGKVFLHDWFVFDPRGWAVRAPPVGELWLDPEALYQRDPRARGVGRYTVAGGELTIAWLDGSPPLRAPLEIGFGELRIAGAAYARADGRSAGFRAAGRFRTSRGATLELHEDGTFRAGEASGRFRVEADRLLLTFPDGRTERHTFFVDRGLLYVDGELMRR